MKKKVTADEKANVKIQQERDELSNKVNEYEGKKMVNRGETERKHMENILMDYYKYVSANTSNQREVGAYIKLIKSDLGQI